MTLTDRVGAAFKALTASPGALEAISRMGGSYFSFPRSQYVDGVYTESVSASYAHIYGTQENVRIVVDAIARAASKRSLKCYDRQKSGQKKEDSEFEAADTLRDPNDWQAQRDILGSLIRDKLIFDDAFLWDLGPVEGGKRLLLRVPPFAIEVSSDNSMQPKAYRIKFQDGSFLPLRADQVIHWKGYNPLHSRMGVSPLETLRTLLTETSVRKAQSIDMIRGGMVRGGIVTRSLEAPAWGNKARERFQESFASRLKGTTRGEVAMLEDGMDFKDAGISPREAEMLANREFELGIVANVFGVNPGLFNASGNLAQAREMLDEDVVDPMLAELAETLTDQLIRTIYQDDTHFFRFRAAKLTDIGALYTAAAQATGGSVLTANEFREDYLDKPPIDGGDELVKQPGAQAGATPPGPTSAPRGRPALPAADQGTGSGPDAGTGSGDVVAKEIGSMLTKAQEERLTLAAHRDMTVERRDEYAKAHEEVFLKHFKRQLRSMEGGRV